MAGDLGCCISFSRVIYFVLSVSFSGNSSRLIMEEQFRRTARAPIPGGAVPLGCIFNNCACTLAATNVVPLTFFTCFTNLNKPSYTCLYGSSSDTLLEMLCLLKMLSLPVLLCLPKFFCSLEDAFLL